MRNDRKTPSAPVPSKPSEKFPPSQASKIARAAVLLAFALAAFAVANSVRAASRLPYPPDDASSDDAPDTSGESRNFNLSYRITITPPAGSHKVRLWIPLPASDRFQTISQLAVQAPSSVHMVRNASSSGRSASFTMDSASFSGPFEIRVSFHVVRYERDSESLLAAVSAAAFPNTDSSSLGAPPAGSDVYPEEVARYLAPDRPADGATDAAADLPADRFTERPTARSSAPAFAPAFVSAFAPEGAMAVPTPVRTTTTATVPVSNENPGSVATFAREQTQGLTGAFEKARKIYEVLSSTGRLGPSAVVAENDEETSPEGKSAERSAKEKAAGEKTAGEIASCASSRDTHHDPARDPHHAASRAACSDFYSLFIEMARAVGVPARFGVGLSLPERQNEGTLPGFRAWAEFYVAGAGWIPVDAPQSGQPDSVFGAMDADRVMLSAGRDAVAPSAPRQDAPDSSVYPYIEVDGQPYSHYSSDAFFHETGIDRSPPSKKPFYANNRIAAPRRHLVS